MLRHAAALAGFLLAPALLLAEENPPGKGSEKPEKAEKKESPEGEPQEKGRPANAEFEPYVLDLEATYVPPEEEKGEQAIQLKFNLSTDVPKGAKIRFTLELFSLPVDETEYELKDENRKGLTLTWKPQKRLATGEYYIRTHLDPEKQTPAVARSVKQNAKRFPPKNAPWSSYIWKPVKVGSPEDEAKEAELLCAAYTEIMDKLIANHNEFKDKMDQVKAGKELVNGAALDKEKFEAFVKEWREKQGAVQKEILQFQVKEPGLVQKSQTAYTKVQTLGRMVSKRSVQLQTEVTDQYKAGVINPVVKDFDRSHRYKVGAKALEEIYGNIRQLVGCPEEDSGDPKDAAPAPGADEKK